MSPLQAVPSRRFTPVLLLIAASTGLSMSAARLERFPGDLPVAEWVQSISVPLFDELMRGVSGVGWWVPGSIVTLCAGLALAALGRRRDGGLLVALVGVSAGLNWAIKRIIASPRPDPALLDVREELSAYGFPSGHVLFAVVCFGGLALMLSGGAGRLLPLRRSAQAVLVLLVPAMVLARVYLGAHWPSDTLGALVMGSVYLFAMAGARGWLQGQPRGVLESARPT